MRMITYGYWDGDGVAVQSFNNHSYNDCWDDDGDGAEGNETDRDGRRWNERE